MLYEMIQWAYLMIASDKANKQREAQNKLRRQWQKDQKKRCAK